MAPHIAVDGPRPTVTLEAGGADPYTPRAIPGSEASPDARLPASQVSPPGSPLAVVDHLGERAAARSKVSPLDFGVVPDGDGADGFVVVWYSELGSQRLGFVGHDPEVDRSQAPDGTATC